jgi:ferredoxin
MHLNAENARQIIRPRGGEIVEEEGKKSRGRTRVTQKMLKMRGDPEMCMKTKDCTTICPTQRATFVPGWTLFYTKIQAFCRN